MLDFFIIIFTFLNYYAASVLALCKNKLCECDCYLQPCIITRVKETFSVQCVK